MAIMTFPVNLKTTSGLSILLHGIISLPDRTSYIPFKYNMDLDIINRVMLMISLGLTM